MRYNQISVIDILQFLAFVSYAAAAIATIVFFCSGESFSSLVALFSGLVSGTVLLGFAEIIKLLHEINNKLK